MVNCESVGSSSVLYFPKRSFCDGEVGDGSGGMIAICSQSEAADDVISGEDVETFRTKQIEISHVCNARTRIGPLAPNSEILRVK